MSGRLKIPHKPVDVNISGTTETIASGFWEFKKIPTPQETEARRKQIKRSRAKGYGDFCMLNNLSRQIYGAETLTEMRVLMFCIQNTDLGNKVNVTQDDMARFLGSTKQTVSKTMKVLSKKGLICHAGKKGHSNIWYVSPFVAWKGDVSALDDAKSMHEKGLPWWESESLLIKQ